MAPQQQQSKSIVFPAVVIAVSAAVIQLVANGQLSQYVDVVPAATKPYGTFDAFWPHYLAEHSQPWTRRLHFIGTSIFLSLIVLRYPALLVCVAAGLSAGFAAFPFLRGVPNGKIELCLMVGVYLATGKAATGSTGRALLPMVVAYAFAWVGHFYIEGNRPATFIYPAFSLLVRRHWIDVPLPPVRLPLDLTILKHLCCFTLSLLDTLAFNCRVTSACCLRPSARGSCERMFPRGRVLSQ